MAGLQINAAGFAQARSASWRELESPRVQVLSSKARRLACQAFQPGAQYVRLTMRMRSLCAPRICRSTSSFCQLPAVVPSESCERISARNLGPSRDSTSWRPRACRSENGSVAAQILNLIRRSCPSGAVTCMKRLPPSATLCLCALSFIVGRFIQQIPGLPQLSQGVSVISPPQSWILV